MDLSDFNLIMETKNTAEKHTIRWTIRRIKKMPEMIRSNKFALVSRQPNDWHMTISLSSATKFQVSLTYSPEYSSRIIVQHLVRILMNDGVTLVGYTHSENAYFGGEEFVFLKDIKLPQNEEDIITVECSMTIYGYDLYTTCDLFDEGIGQSNIADLQSGYNKMISDKYADVKINVGKGCFNAHRCILKFRVPTFFRLHREEILEGNVTLSDIERHIFEIILQYIYSMKTFEIDITINCSEIYPVAIKYDLKGLHKLCSEEMVFEMRSSNVCDFFLLAQRHKDEELLGHCKVFMRENKFLVQKESKWNQLVATKPHLVNEINKE